VGSLKLTNLQFLLMCVFVTVENKLDIVVHYDNNPPTPIKMTLNDLECPIHLKVLF